MSGSLARNRPETKKASRRLGLKRTGPAPLAGRQGRSSNRIARLGAVTHGRDPASTASAVNQQQRRYTGPNLKRSADERVQLLLYSCAFVCLLGTGSASAELRLDRREVAAALRAIAEERRMPERAEHIPNTRPDVADLAPLIAVHAPIRRHFPVACPGVDALRRSRA